MALNYIWTGFFLIGFVAALAQWLFLGDVEVFKRIIDGTFESAKTGVMDIALPLAGVMTLWLGIMKIGEKAGAIDFIAKIIAPFFVHIFPGVPKNHPANGHMVMNFSANLLGLDNAATPFGLKAMESLQSLNPDKEEASDAQIMFLVLHTSGLTLIPLAIMAQRAVLGAKDPSDIFIPCMIATYVATVVGLISVAIRQRINLLNRIVIGWLGGMSAFIIGMVWYLSLCMTRPEIEVFSKLSSNLLLLTIIVAFMLGAMRKRINVYDAFIEGAKGGMQTSLTISGSGSRAMMVDAMKTYGVDSFVGRLACIFQGSADTTFYIVALYFGSVGIRKTRYAIPMGLLADFAGVVAAIFVAYLFFH